MSGVEALVAVGGVLDTANDVVGLIKELSNKTVTANATGFFDPTENLIVYVVHITLTRDTWLGLKHRYGELAIDIRLNRNKPEETRRETARFFSVDEMAQVFAQPSPLEDILQSSQKRVLAKYPIEDLKKLSNLLKSLTSIAQKTINENKKIKEVFQDILTRVMTLAKSTGWSYDKQPWITDACKGPAPSEDEKLKSEDHRQRLSIFLECKGEEKADPIGAAPVVAAKADPAVEVAPDTGEEKVDSIGAAPVAVATTTARGHGRAS